MPRSRSVTKSAEHRLRRAVIAGLSRLVRRSSPPPQPSDLSKARVLLIRQDRIGDVLVSTPLINELKRRRPDVTLDILVSTNNQVAVDGIPSIRKRWVYRKSLFPIIALLRGIRRERYDVVMDLMDNPSATSTVLCLFSGARWTIGIAKENEYVYDVKVPLLSRRDVHIVRRIAELLRPFGIVPSESDLRLSYQTGSDADARAWEILRAAGCDGKRTLCVNISAGSPNRYWGTDRYAEFLQACESAFPAYAIAIVCSPIDRPTAEALCASAHRTILLPPTDRFRDFAALLKHMACIVTPDTAVVHLAAAFGVPSVVMYIQTDPDLRVWEPYGSPHRSLVSREDSLHSILPEDVLQAVRELLTAGQRRSTRRPVKKR